jgi:rRNA-processing protein CGR1
MIFSSQPNLQPHASNNLLLPPRLPLNNHTTTQCPNPLRHPHPCHLARQMPRRQRHVNSRSRLPVGRVGNRGSCRRRLPSTSSLFFTSLLILLPHTAEVIHRSRLLHHHRDPHLPLLYSPPLHSHCSALTSLSPPLRRSHLMPGVKSASWDQRLARRAALSNVKKLESTMLAERQAEEDAKVNAIKERRKRKEENKRLADMAAKMSAKKLQRMKKRLGRTKNKTG